MNVALGQSRTAGLAIGVFVVDVADQAIRFSRPQRSPLVFDCVDGQAVAEIVASWTGIPAGRMRSDEIRNVLNLRGRLEERVIGQSHALDAIGLGEILQRHRDPGRRVLLRPGPLEQSPSLRHSQAIAAVTDTAQHRLARDDADPSLPPAAARADR